MKMKDRITLRDLLTYYVDAGETFRLVDIDIEDDSNPLIGEFETSKFLAIASDKLLDKKVKRIHFDYWNVVMEVEITDGK